MFRILSAHIDYTTCMQVRYLTQLNTKPRILKWYTPGELVFVMFASFVPFIFEILMGLTPNLLTVFIMWALLTLVVVYFRIGKPEGYLYHLIKSLFTPDEFRVGGCLKSPKNYPIAPIYNNFEKKRN